MVISYYLYGMAAKKEIKQKEKERRQNYSYVTFPSIAEQAKSKAFHESPSKTLSSKVEELLIKYLNS